VVAKCEEGTRGEGREKIALNGRREATRGYSKLLGKKRRGVSSRSTGDGRTVKPALAGSTRGMGTLHRGQQRAN